MPDLDSLPDTTTRPDGVPGARMDAQRNRRQLIVATREAVASRGLEVSARDIATAAGVGVGTLYRRFGTKEALLGCAMLGLYDELLDTARRCLQRADAWDGLTEFVMTLAGAHRDSRGLAEVTAMCDGPVSPERAQRTVALQDAVFRLTERAQTAGALRPDVTWQDVLICSRAALDVDRCLGIDAGPDGWRRVIAIVLDGMRVHGRSPLQGPGPQIHPGMTEPATNGESPA
ncbi:TetR/AcrR family transcriptional regulator [Micromonospora krabiensis]|uniref:Transcriptional regulator, TetR family n=1 Tax=Micromonospora krabiensis TaxID=307121 RepID=A0A1C3MXH7_9ACTN|nr:TetR/AcrR family transcriptional regulator [Micromonospora krabiensis]SBV25011.1 transcriptional regulator, TetR family [Micromonospora krabiensis]